MTEHRPQAERKAQILAAARDTFVHRGYAETRVEDVAKAAGLSKGAVYFHYASKLDLFMALVLAEHDASYHVFEEVEQTDLPALGKLLLMGRLYLEWFGGLEQPPRFFLMMTELALRDEGMRAQCEALHQRFVDAVARVLAQGVAEGTFRPLDPVLHAQILKALIDGFAGHAAIGVAPDRASFAVEGFYTLARGILADPAEADRILEVVRGMTAALEPAGENG